MAVTVEKRKKFIINVFYYVLIFGAFYLFMRFAFWMLFPFLFAFFFAMVMQKPVNRVVKHTPLKKGFVSFLVTFFVLVVILGLVALLGTKIASEVKSFVQYLTATFENIPDFINKAEGWLLNLVSSLPKSLQNAVVPSIENLADKLLTSFAAEEDSQALTQTSSGGLSITSLLTPLSGVISTASKVPSILVAIVVCFIACCFMTADYGRIVGFIKRQLPENKRTALSKTKALTLGTIAKMAKAYCIIIVITCTEMSLGLSALKLLGIYTGGYIFLIALATAVVDILPILGSGVVLVPWSIISLVTGNVGMCIGLLVVYVIISVLRQFIEPRLVAGQLGLPPIATLMGMYIGLKLLGVIGMFIVPITINVLKVLNDDGVVRLWKNKGEAEATANGSMPFQGLKLKQKKKGRNAHEQNH